MSEQELVVLKRKRASIKARLTQFSNYVAKLETDLNSTENQVLDELVVIELEQRVMRNEQLLTEHDEVQGQIECVVESSDEQFEERENFESKFFTVLSLAKKLLNHHHERRGVMAGSGANSNDSDRNSVTGGARLSGIKLPTINLPKFDGDYEAWLEYRDTYKSLIHCNADINDVQKFHYLRASLTGSASNVIKSIELSSANYMLAWDLLCERYDNARLLVNNHVKALFSMEAIGKECSAKTRKLLDTVSKNLRALETLGQPTQQWDTLIIFIIVSKLDSVTVRYWEEYKANNELPTLDDLKTFLRARADLLETLEASSAEKRKLKQGATTTAFFVSDTKCALCKGDHFIYSCENFLKLSIDGRMEEVGNLKLCHNCLRPGHIARFCKHYRCKKCKGRHNTLLHFEKSDRKHETTSSSSVAVANNDLVSLSSNVCGPVLLPTVRVNVVDAKGRVHVVRALLDVGSQSSFITTALCDKLGINKTKFELRVAGINECVSSVKFKCEVEVRAMQGSYTVKVSCLVLPNITGCLPSTEIDVSEVKIPRNVKLADPSFNKPKNIELLLGAEHFWQVICVGQIKLGRGLPVLQKTRFGWVVTGPASTKGNETKEIRCHLVQNLELQDQLRRFWELEEIPAKPLWSKEEQECEAHFCKTHKRASDGRFVVQLPLKLNPSVLGDSEVQAKRRFSSLERKLVRDTNLRAKYCEFLSEYERLGHMTEVSNIDCQDVGYYMPHHGVTKEESSTTKLRVVFDASAATTSGKSLNDIQMVGPVLQDDLLAIILRFRCHNYVVAADVEKMYRQVLIDPSQRSLQRILWRPNSEVALKTYELNTVTYGTAAASFLAIRCLHQLSQECKNMDPLLAEVIAHDFYVDDLLSGGRTIEEAKHIYEGVTKELDKGCFHLRKWKTNESSIVSHESREVSGTVEFHAQESSKTLGLIWLCETDMLCYRVLEHSCYKLTKRGVLSCIARIFDPLGLLSPCVIIPKMMLQQLWQEELSWDESLPINLHTKWLKFVDDLQALNHLRISRQVMDVDYEYVELHVFADASQQAYGACVYVRSTNDSGRVVVRLLCAKTRVAPLKVQTIPRLELCAAVVAVRLVEKVRTSVRLNFERCVYWSDSTVVLAWIKTSANTLKPFVGNRVAEIQHLSETGRWRHVPSEENPADLLTRGLLPSDILDTKIWWNGPPWLSADENIWPTSIVEQSELPELRKTKERTSCVTQAVGEVFPVDKFSKLSKLNRVLAYCLRFKHNCLSPSDKKIEQLTAKELKETLLILVRAIQRSYFQEEIRLLEEGKRLRSSSRILSLNPFLDEQGMLRVGGRLRYSKFDYMKKHPALLPKGHHFCKLLFEQEHQRLLHAGPRLLLAAVREQYWPLGALNMAKKTVRKCVTCFRVCPRAQSPLMGSLPERRVTPAPPFAVTGVDYAGPFSIRDRKGRGSKLSKSYICLFVCFVTKALHLELVTDLSKDTFMMALRRFISRRGKPNHIYSDNGTNFLGAKNELERLGEFLVDNSKDLVDCAAQEGVEWHFIPPHAPTFGGLWESGVKSVKFHLKRVMQNAALTYEQMYTLLVQIEATLNSRPLSPLSTDPNDLSPLTPAHFLIGRCITGLPDDNLLDKVENRLAYHQRLQQLHQHFWVRWSREYISQLQQRCKWKKNSSTLQEGALVVVKEDHQPPLMWQLGRVVALHPGKDCVARVASIRTSRGLIKRPLTKVCPLPIETSETIK